MAASPSQSGWGLPPKPENPEGLPTKLGWHEDDEGRPVQVANEARMFRTPMAKYAAADWPLRSTWALHRGAWTQLENRVKYASLELLLAPLKPSVEKLITRFEEYRACGVATRNGGPVALVPQPSTTRARPVAEDES